MAAGKATSKAAGKAAGKATSEVTSWGWGHPADSIYLYYLLATS